MAMVSISGPGSTVLVSSDQRRELTSNQKLARELFRELIEITGFGMTGREKHATDCTKFTEELVADVTGVKRPGDSCVVSAVDDHATV